MKRQTILLLFLLLIVTSCCSTGNKRKHSQCLRLPEIEVTEDSSGKKTSSRVDCNSIYHWKTTFKLDEDDLRFLKRHSVRRMYIRLFDVDLDTSPLDQYSSAIPVGTTSFKGAIPDSIEAVPVVFITTKAMKFTGEEVGGTANLASKIYTRIRNMSDFNDLGHIGEIQLDCDWTKSTQEAFYELCKEIKALAEKDGILVSSTIRLHQLSIAPPPVDRGVLMVYNTGAIRSPETRNSILDYDDVVSYLGGKTIHYPLPLDFAYPAFGWGVLFRKGKYMGILHKTDYERSYLYPEQKDGSYIVREDHILEGHSLMRGDVIRLEQPSAELIDSVATLVSKSFGETSHSTILYHLDSKSLSKYDFNEISKIYSR